MLPGMERWYVVMLRSRVQGPQLTKANITHFAAGVCGEDSMQLARG